MDDVSDLEMDPTSIFLIYIYIFYSDCIYIFNREICSIIWQSKDSKTMTFLHKKRHKFQMLNT